MATDVTSPVNRLTEAEASILGLTTAEKLELIERIARSIRSEYPTRLTPAEEEERAERQYQNRLRLHAEITSMASVTNDDGFSNRDHDEVIYGLPG